MITPVMVEEQPLAAAYDNEMQEIVLYMQQSTHT